MGHSKSMSLYSDLTVQATFPFPGLTVDGFGCFPEHRGQTSVLAVPCKKAWVGGWVGGFGTGSAAHTSMEAVASPHWPSLSLEGEGTADQAAVRGRSTERLQRVVGHS